MKILYRGESIYSDEVFETYDIKYELDMVYLRVKNTWREVSESTLSVHLPYMKDRNKNKIFASLNENNITNKLRLFEFETYEPYTDRNVVLKDSQVYIQSLEDKTIECGFYLLDLDYVEIIKE